MQFISKKNTKCNYIIAVVIIRTLYVHLESTEKVQEIGFKENPPIFMFNFCTFFLLFFFQQGPIVN